MSEQTNQVERTDEQQRIYAQQQYESTKFLSSHLNDEQMPKRNPANAQKLANYIQHHKMPWTAESLEQAYAALVEADELEMEENPAVYPELEVKAPVNSNVGDLYPWGEELSRESFKSLSGSEMLKWRKSRQWSGEFNRQIAALGVRV
jgi:hypothetical protein